MSGITERTVQHKSLTIMRDEDFVYEGKLNEGGYGTVYKGRHTNYMYPVAIKKLKLGSGDVGEWSREDLHKEIGILESIRHPHIVFVYGCISEPSCFGLVMEVAEHGSMSDFVRLLLPARLPLSLAVRMIHQVVLGMHFLHSLIPSILHLDLKADNVLIFNDFSVKIADFGLSEMRQYLLSHTIELVQRSDAPKRGTLSHVPPEKLENLNIVPGKKYDVYGFAILVWELLTGRRAFEDVDRSLVYELVPKGKRPPIDKVREDTPPTFLQMMQDCWHAMPQQRPDFSGLKDITQQVLNRYMPLIENDKMELMNAIVGLQSPKSLAGRYVPPAAVIRRSSSEKAGSSTTLAKIIDSKPGLAGAKGMGSAGPAAVIGSPTSTGLPMERKITTNKLQTDLSALGLNPKSITDGAALRTSVTSSSLLVDSGPSSSHNANAGSSCQQLLQRRGTAAVPYERLADVSGELSPQGVLAQSPSLASMQADAEPGPVPNAGSSASSARSGQGSSTSSGMHGVTARTASPSGSSAPHSGSSNNVRSTTGRGSSNNVYSKADASNPVQHGYPWYEPFRNGFKYYPCPGLEPVFVPAVNGALPPGMPAPGSMFPAGSPLKQETASNKSSVTYQHNGIQTHIYNTGGSSNMQLGNRNIMYINTGSGRGTEGAAKNPPRPFDKSKLTKSKRKITEDDMNTLAEHVGQHWKALARKLGFSEGRIDILENDHRISLYEQIYQMLKGFHARFGDEATIDVVVRALCDINQPQIAAVLREDEHEEAAKKDMSRPPTSATGGESPA